MKKKKQIWIISIISLIAVLAIGSWAISVNTGTAGNVITAGNIRLALHEISESAQTDPTGIVYVTAGDKIARTVTVENTGNNSAFIRISVSSLSEDTQLNLKDCVVLDINVADWIYRDGYYYFKRELRPGETTSPLFTSFTFDKQKLGDYSGGKKIDIEVYAYGVQSKNNGNDPLYAMGWPEKAGR